MDTIFPSLLLLCILLIYYNIIQSRLSDVFDNISRSLNKVDSSNQEYFEKRSMQKAFIKAAGITNSSAAQRLAHEYKSSGKNELDSVQLKTNRCRLLFKRRLLLRVAIPVAILIGVLNYKYGIVQFMLFSTRRGSSGDFFNLCLFAFSILVCLGLIFLISAGACFNGLKHKELTSLEHRAKQCQNTINNW